MKKQNEKGKDFYNDVYSRGGWKGVYFAKYTDTHYYEVWKVVLGFIGDNDLSVLDVGCGPGQFAEMMFDHGVKNYTGFDFSEQAVKMAKQVNAGNEDRFFLGDIFDAQIFDGEYDLYVCLEVLEHISDDLGLFERIPSGKEVICSVPNFSSEGHLRIFKSAQDVVARYSGVLDVSSVVAVDISNSGNAIFVFKGKRI